jgi:hypothetical protein
MSLNKSNSKPPTIKETSPVFHQFLDAVYQIMYNNPARFEFNERFLRRLLYHTYSCQYGSFLYDSEKERVGSKVRRKTRCVWDYFLARRKEFLNPEFDGSLDVGEGVLFPKGEGVRWWAQAWGRTDAEMNGPGRGTNVRDEVVKAKEERHAKESREREDALRERLERVVRTTSPRKEQLFDGVGSSPLKTKGTTVPDEAEVKDAFVEVEVADTKLETPVSGIDAVVEETNVTVLESSDETSLGGSASVISSALEDNGLEASGFVTDPFGVELDPLGGGVEMSSLSITNTSLRNR